VCSLSRSRRQRNPNTGRPLGQWIRADKRLAIYLRDRFLCLYCCRDLHDADPADVTLDHVRPRSGGGSNGEGNLITACRSCNCARQDRPLARFAGPEARQHIRRNTRRNLRRYRTLARALIAGECGLEQTLQEVEP
jgi:5-methylcytosine-specific restriction endonuclease McrA